MESYTSQVEFSQSQCRVSYICALTLQPNNPISSLGPAWWVRKDHRNSNSANVLEWWMHSTSQALCSENSPDRLYTFLKVSFAQGLARDRLILIIFHPYWIFQFALIFHLGRNNLRLEGRILTKQHMMGPVLGLLNSDGERFHSLFSVPFYDTLL